MDKDKTKIKYKTPVFQRFLDDFGILWKFNWWRRRESNPRPRALDFRVYMFILSFILTTVSPAGRIYQ